MKLSKKIKRLINNTDFWVDEVIKSILPVNNNIVPEINTRFGMMEKNLFSQISELILRVDKDINCSTTKNIEKIITCGYWPENRDERELYRFVIENNSLVGIFIDIAVNVESIEEIYNLIISQIEQKFQNSSKQHKDPLKFKNDENKYPMLTWEDECNYMFMSALWAYPIKFDRRDIIERYIFLDQQSKITIGYQPWKIDDYIEGMFIIKNMKILPTIGILVAPNEESRDFLKNYLVYSMQRFPQKKRSVG